jgi:hypothetical protein
MNELELSELYKKYAPTGAKFFFRGGVILLTCILLGIGYGYTLMEIPPDLTEAEANQFKLGLGFGFGLVLAIFPSIILIVLHIRATLKAKERATLEYAQNLASKQKT